MRIVFVWWIVGVAALGASLQDSPMQVDQGQVIVVEGSVSRPGRYPFASPNSTVLTAIAQAGGLIGDADHKAFIIRVDNQGIRHTIAIRISDILRLTIPDVPLQAGDTLQVPSMPRRPIRDIPQNNSPSPSVSPHPA